MAATAKLKRRIGPPVERSHDSTPQPPRVRSCPAPRFLGRVGKEGDVSSRQKILIGALGAATPLALNFLVVDLLTLSSPTVLAAAGYAVRVAGLIGLGTFIVFLNLDEPRRSRVFQLG